MCDTAQNACPHHETGLLDWHNPTTWPGGVLPAANAAVTVPAASKVLISQSVNERLGLVTIPVGAQLIIGGAANIIRLNASGIAVYGALRAGSETCRLQNQVEITLHGTRPSTRAARHALPPSSKGIYVSGGTLDLHGKLFHRTWARLARTVQAGDTIVLLQAAVNWEAGQRIVLVTSALKDTRDWHRNEEASVASVRTTGLPDGVGSAVLLSAPARYAHEANGDYQVEVGLLSRRIVVQGGADDSEPTDQLPVACEDTDTILQSRSVPCPSTFLTGFGAHVLVTGSAGIGRIAGVELHRMGQTNVLGRYPMHFHLLGSRGGLSYLTDSSIHRSYYRGVSLHGTSYATIARNVAFDVIGFCYYLEDGVEEHNVIEHNLAALVHFIGAPARASGQFTGWTVAHDELILPADVAASGFYVTNANNRFRGNAASGGWSGFAFPQLQKPVKLHRSSHAAVNPSEAALLEFAGNSAHSSGWHGKSLGASIYFGGRLEHDSSQIDRSTGEPVLRYNPGRANPARTSATVLRDTKVFLTIGIGILHWGSCPEIINADAHDLGLSFSILGHGFIRNAYVRCRTGAPLALPAGSSSAVGMSGNGFAWYDTNQAHIVVNTTFHSCGLRTASGQGSGTTDGCSDDASDGSAGGARCHRLSSVWSLLGHSDEHVPEFMQASKGIRYVSCGRRFRMQNFVTDHGGSLTNGMSSTVSMRIASWYDADGTASGRGTSTSPAPTIIGSRVAEAGEWWRLDGSCADALGSESPVRFCSAARLSRQIGSINLVWGRQASVGSSVCGNGAPDVPCTPVGYIKHWGGLYGTGAGAALPVTLNGEIAGPLGGFGWHLRFGTGAPRQLNISRVQVPHDTKLLLSVAYPSNVTSVSVVAHAPSWCLPWESASRRCSTTFSRVSSIALVRASLGDTYHLEGGVLTVRIVQPPKSWTAKPTWTVPINPEPPFVRDGVRIPRYSWHSVLRITAACTTSSADPTLCAGNAVEAEPLSGAVCASGYMQTAYDQCCSGSGGQCVDPDGQSTAQ